jgi:alkanesulfonate monooxygenase SsuD/methylene tetrahydromethanopterin reductase-like flavin-dependent oxidoreductase (luciferase family)
VPPSPSLSLAVALKAAGWHPAADGGLVPWVDQVREAQRGLLDFVTIEDGDGELDAVAVAERVAPLTRRVGIVAVQAPGGPAPLAVAQAIGRLDVLSGGRAGWLARSGPTAEDRDRTGEHVALVRRVWDGAMADDQAQPVVVVRARDAHACRTAARAADVVLLAPADGAELAALLPETAERRAFVDVAVVLENDAGAARARLARLEALVPLRSVADAAVFAGTPAQLADHLRDWAEAGATGIRLLPANTARDLPLITRTLVPELQQRGCCRTAYEGGTLRDHLGLWTSSASRRCSSRRSPSSSTSASARS